MNNLVLLKKNTHHCKIVTFTQNLKMFSNGQNGESYKISSIRKYTHVHLANNLRYDGIQYLPSGQTFLLL